MKQTKKKLNILTIIGFLHISIGIVSAISIIFSAAGSVRDVTPHYLALEFALSSVVRGYLFRAIPFILGGIGILAKKNLARIFLIIFHLISFWIYFTPSLHFALQGQFGIPFLAFFPLAMVVYLNLPSIKQHFLIAEENRSKGEPPSRKNETTFFLLSLLPILLIKATDVFKRWGPSTISPVVSLLIVSYGISLFVRGRSCYSVGKKIAFIVAIIIAGLPLIFIIKLGVLIVFSGFPHPH